MLPDQLNWIPGCLACRLPRALSYSRARLPRLIKPLQESP